MNSTNTNLNLGWKFSFFPLICSLVICLFLAACSESFYGGKKGVASPNVIIKSVQIGAMNADSDPTEFSVLINFINYGTTIDRWQFGFYMPATFYRLVDGNQNYNPRLMMKICDNQNKCARLRYEKASHIAESDLSQGYTTILAPAISFPLLHGNTYTIKLLHNNQWGSGNISSFPQNIFFVLPGMFPSGGLQKIYKAATIISTYTFVNYDQKSIDVAMSDHTQTNWANSIPYDTSIDNINVVPSPVQIQIKTGQIYTIKKSIAIHNQLNSGTCMNLIMSRALQKDLNVNVTIDNQADAASGILIQRLINTDVIQGNPEGYVLMVNANNIVIQAINDAGVYYAFQTLRQLWNSAANKNGTTLPLVSLIDYPRFKYRGVLLDTARHFFSVSNIKSFIDIMGSHKLNTLHLHLSDDEAFRLILPVYPTLQSVGSKRGFGLPIGPMMFIQGSLYKKSYKDITFADTEYLGAYSESDIASIIAYANANQITVIPEIDLPTHARALIKSLPKALIDPNEHSQFISAQGYTDNVLPVCTYDTTISVGPIFTKIINTIVNRVAGLFNGQTTLYAINNEVSVGGDEVSPHAWTNNRSCRGTWSNLSALQKSHKFFQQMALINSALTLSGWQQFIQTNGGALGNTIVPTNRTGHVWVWNTSGPGIPQAIALASKGYPTVLVYADKTYFDLAYTPDVYEPGFSWASQYSDTQAALTSAMTATNTLRGVHSHAQANVIGLEGALWSENLTNYQQMIYMALPKMAGLSEASWSASRVTVNNMHVNWQSLATRLGCGQTGFLAYLHKLFRVHYRGYPNGIKLETPLSFCS